MDDLASLAALLARCGEKENAPAQRLIAEFGSVGAVLAAEPERLSRVVAPPTVGLIAAVRRVMLAALRPSAVASDEVGLSNTGRVQDYLRSRLGHAEVEEVHVLHLDRELRLVRDELVARGARNQVLIEPREIIRRALDLGAEALMIAHNHPSGCTTPSLGDVAASRQLAACGALFGIRLIDHVLVTRTATVSLVAEKLL